MLLSGLTFGTVGWCESLTNAQTEYHVPSLIKLNLSTVGRLCRFVRQPVFDKETHLLRTAAAGTRLCGRLLVANADPKFPERQREAQAYECGDKGRGSNVGALLPLAHGTRRQP